MGTLTGTLSCATPTAATHAATKGYVDDYRVYSGNYESGVHHPPKGTSWGLAWTATGRYTVTHNLGTTSYSVNATGNFGFCVYRGASANAVNIYRFQENAGTLGFADGSFAYTIQLI